MKSRTKKWAHYREKIKKLPPEKFSKRKVVRSAEPQVTKRLPL